MHAHHSFSTYLPNLGDISKTLKGPFTLRDETMSYQTLDCLITFNNGLGPLKTKSGRGVSQGDGSGGGMCWAGILS